MQGIKITGTGSYIPDRVVTNEDFTRFLDTSDEWIYTRTGIKSRFYNTDKMNFQMGAAAAENALKNIKLVYDNNELELALCLRLPQEAD